MIETKKQRVLIYVLSYNAERTLRSVLDRLPEELYSHSEYTVEILIIDDCSPDSTFDTGYALIQEFKKCPVTILRNPENLGMGGNQKVGYQYAIQHGFDHVVLLHGDGQYAPEVVPELLLPLVNREADAVYGSRMMNACDALKGGMPRYKWYGNKILTRLENFLAQTDLTEYHCGLRLYSVSALKAVPFHYNSDYFDFDTDIILQFHEAGHRLVEKAIPTYYGDEECNVDGIKYARKILSTCLLYRVQKWGIFYHPKFDIRRERAPRYRSKHRFESSHSKALSFVAKEDAVLLIGKQPEEFLELLRSETSSLEVLDPTEFSGSELEDRLRKQQRSISKLLILDALELVESAEGLLETVRKTKELQGAKILLCLGNVGFLPIRAMLLLGYFNYGIRGILDKVHRRLFTFQSAKNLLRQHGFEVHAASGLPAPYPLAFGEGRFSSLLLSLNQFFLGISKRLFGYQIVFEASPKPTLEVLLERAVSNTATEVEKRIAEGKE